MLDPRAEAARAPLLLRLLVGVERSPIGEVADRVHGDRKAGSGAPSHDLDELFVADDLDAAPVEHERGARAERPVQERLDVPDPEQIVAEADARPMLEAFELIPGKGLPDAQVERAFLAETLEDAQGPQPAVLVVDRDDSA